MDLGQAKGGIEEQIPHVLQFVGGELGFVGIWVGFSHSFVTLEGHPRYDP